MVKLPIDWSLVRMKYEAGDSAYKIAQDLGGRPTKQGISRRAKAEAWARHNNPLVIARELPIVKRAQLLTGPSKCTAERVAFILELVGKGSNVKLACSAAGIGEKTLKRWCNDDQQLSEQLRQARAGKLAEYVSHIDAAASRDWKAADRLLQVAPEAEDYSQQQVGGITIVLNIDRDEVKPVVSEQ